MFDFLLSYVYYIVRPMLKWIIRKTTGKCELLRISLSESQPYNRCIKTEESLKHSKSAELKRLLVEEKIDIDDAVEIIMKIKSISPEVHPQFAPSIKTCLEKIIGYRRLVLDVELVRKVPYSAENLEHERLLMQNTVIPPCGHKDTLAYPKNSAFRDGPFDHQLWKALNPDSPLKARLGQQWTIIGFQGEDPATDFRGMGLLGLHNLVYFVSNHPDMARMLLSHSHHPQLGYSFAIVGINLTHAAFDLLRKGLLKTHFYNSVQGAPSLDDFNHVYCYLFYEFDKFWFAEKPPSIMEFNHYKDKFVRKITNLLKNKTTVLRLNFSREYTNKVSSIQL